MSTFLNKKKKILIFSLPLNYRWVLYRGFYSTSEHGKILNYKGLRQDWSFLNEILSLERVWGFQTWNFISGFLCWVLFTFRYFSNQGCWGYIQSNLIDRMLRKESNLTLFLVWAYGLFICNTTHLVEVSHRNKYSILGLETYLVENSGSHFYPFLG